RRRCPATRAATPRRLSAGRRSAQRALVTLPALRQRVHTYTRRGVPASSMRTRWRLGSKRRRVATIEWLRLLPYAGPFAHTWQILAIAGSIGDVQMRPRRDQPHLYMRTIWHL